MRASAAAVVKSLVLEAGVKSLSPFCEYNVSPLAAETTSIPQKPRARSGALRTAAMRSCSGGAGAANSGAAHRIAMEVRAARERRRNMDWIVTPTERALVRWDRT